MVTRIEITLPLVLAALLLLGAVPAVHADGLLEQMQNEIAAIVRANKGGVVAIEDEGAPPPHRADANSDSRRLAGQQGRRGPNALERANAPKSGSGFLIGNGYVVTTADVVEGMQRPLVIADDGTRMRAKIVGIDSEMNLGVLQLPAKANLSALKIGDSDTVAAGHFAISVGNQAGHANSVALAMIAGIRTDGTHTGDHFYPALLQIAGTIGAGTSGAPLLNARGEVIGVIAGVPAGEWTETQVYTEPSFRPAPGGREKDLPPDAPRLQKPQPEPRADQSEQAHGKNLFVFGQAPFPTEQNGIPPMRVFLRPPVTGTGFAIPINDLRFSIKELIANGKIVRTWVGVDLKPDRKVNDEDGIIKVVRYVRIRGIYPDSPAQKAGLQPGDILVELNAKPVMSLSGVRATFMRLHPADKLAITVERNGVKQTMTLNVVARPDRIIPPAELPNAHPK